MEFVVSGWGRDHGEKIIARRDLTEARSWSAGGYQRPEVYITTREGKEASPIFGLRAIRNGNVELHFYSKITLNGEYLARLTLTRMEVAKLFLSQYADCPIHELLDVIAQVREVSLNRKIPPVMYKNLDELGLSSETVRRLTKSHVCHVGDLVQKTEAQLRELPEIDNDTFWEVKERLAPWGLQLGMRPEGWSGIPFLFFRELDDFELSVRTSNCLKSEGIRYIGDLVQKTAAEMLRVSSFGRKSLNEIKETVLEPLGLQFGMTVQNWRPPRE